MSHEEKYEEFKQQCKALGWKVYADSSPEVASGARLPFYVCKNPQFVHHECICNEKKPILVAYLWHFYPGLYNNFTIHEHTSVELCVHGELPNKSWVKFEVTCDWHDLLNENKLTSFDKILSAAYDAAYEATIPND